MNEETLKQFLTLLMRSDPWPVEDEESQKIMVSFANEESNRHGFDGWVDAYQKL